MDAIVHICAERERDTTDIFICTCVYMRRIGDGRDDEDKLRWTYSTLTVCGVRSLPLLYLYIYIWWYTQLQNKLNLNSLCGFSSGQHFVIRIHSPRFGTVTEYIRRRALYRLCVCYALTDRRQVTSKIVCVSMCKRAEQLKQRITANSI